MYRVHIDIHIDIHTVITEITTFLCHSCASAAQVHNRGLLLLSNPCPWIIYANSQLFFTYKQTIKIIISKISEPIATESSKGKDTKVFGITLAIRSAKQRTAIESSLERLVLSECDSFVCLTARLRTHPNIHSIDTFEAFLYEWLAFWYHFYAIAWQLMPRLMPYSNTDRNSNSNLCLINNFSLLSSK